MKCPYCAEEIQPAAVKCKHCGEWLDKSKAPLAQPIPDATQPRDNASLTLYSVLLTSPGSAPVQRRVLGKDPEEARAVAARAFGSEYSLDEKWGVRPEQPGKFSCPACHSRFTDCHRAIGCAVMVIIFISLGLGLIMIPFLPHECVCKACGHVWKT